MAASQADIDAALSVQTGLETTLLSSVNAVHGDITNLIAKVQAGQAIDLTSELTAIQQNTANLQTALTTLQQSDTAANPPAPGAGSTTASTSAAAGASTPAS